MRYFRVIRRITITDVAHLGFLEVGETNRNGSPLQKLWTLNNKIINRIFFFGGGGPQ